MTNKIKITFKSGVSSDVEMTDGELEAIRKCVQANDFKAMAHSVPFIITLESSPWLLLNEVAMIEKLESMPDPKEK